jgi:potassium/hydrogen antiporter
VEFAPALITIGLLVFLSHLFVAVFERTKVPDVLYLILIGVAIGPIFHVVSPDDFGKVGPVFTTIALVAILFEGGLELRFEQIRSSMGTAVASTVIAYSLAWLFLGLLLYFMMDLSPILATYAGAVLAAPAPAIVLPLIKHLGLSTRAKTSLTLESPLGESLGIVVALGILDSIQIEALNIGPLVGRLIASFTFALVIGGAGGLAWSLVLNKIRQLRFAIFTTPALLLVLFGLAELLGFSGPVTALTFGMVLGNAEPRHFPWLPRHFSLIPLQHNETEKAFFGEIVFLIKTFFFVYLGISLRLDDPWTVGIAASVVGALVFSRFVAVRLSATKSDTSRYDALAMSVMIPRGTAAAVLAALPAQQGLVHGEDLQGVINSVIIFSIIATSFLLFFIHRRFSADRSPSALGDTAPEDAADNATEGVRTETSET